MAASSVLSAEATAGVRCWGVTGSAYQDKAVMSITVDCTTQIVARVDTNRKHQLGTVSLP